ncbi:MAG: exopolysaccharide biosynthesis protein [Alphaproteobacteria bacterium]|nr:exopolysaccharide biosynthesis protein [Alphaproteobacteria bacterium]
MSTAGIADALAHAIDGPDDGRVTLAGLVARLERRGYGMLLFLFSAPNLTPGPSIPGFSTIFALPLAVVAFQMMLGARHPKLPGFLGRLGIARVRARSILDQIKAPLKRAERLLKPRWPALCEPAAQRWIGAVAIVEAGLLLLPLPILPLIPSIALIVLSLGLLARDGRAVALGLGLCALAAGLFAAALLLGAAALGLA